MTGAEQVAAAMRAAAEARRARGETQAASVLFEEALRLQPGHVDTMLALAGLLLAGRAADAEAVALQATSIAPNDPLAWSLLGQASSALLRNREAVVAFEQAARLSPREPGALSNLSVARLRAGDPNGALEAANIAAGLAPDMPEAHANYGHACLVLERNAEAEQAFANAIERKPEFADALMGMARTQRNLGRPSQAIAALLRAFEIAPSDARIGFDLAALWEEIGEHARALDALRSALATPGAPEGMESNLMFSAQYAPDADDAAESDIARAWGLRAVASAPPAPLRPARPTAGRRLRVGYVSADLYRHPVGWLGIGPLRAHDRDAFEILVYANQSRWDETTQALHGAVDRWTPILGLDDDRVAETIAADEIDILVDMSGHTTGNRLGVFARRAAPVQMSWLGYFATTGLPTMDYVLLDDAHLADGAERLFSEAILRMPASRFCYGAPDYAGEPAPPPVLRNRRITFGCFNYSAKLNDAVFDLWARVLRAVEHSDLLLKWASFADPWLQQRVRAKFAARGVDGARVQFDGRTSHQAMLRQYGEIDIALDPFPFGGGLTSCEALWMGVPVVTLPGARPVSRQTLSLLRAFGRTEFVATTADEYVEIAVSLAGDIDRLADLRSRLRPEMAASPLCDAPRFARDLESKYRAIVRS